MKSHSTWFLCPLILLPLAGAAAFLLCPKIYTGDFAEITIESITPTRPGDIVIRYRGRMSVGSRLEEVVRRHDREYRTARGRTNGRLRGRPAAVEPQTLPIYSICNERGLPGQSAETLARLQVQAGRSYRIRPGRPLTIYRYAASDGVLTERYLEVLPRGE